MMENTMNFQSNGANRADTVLQRTWQRREDETDKKGKAAVARHYLPLGRR